ncbi:MAG: hypothetical protein HXS48_13595 [Theionarchaea archaeon]|nr:hypothetical protein [Theionarchaea archaeon]
MNKKKREFLSPQIGNVPNIAWKKVKPNIWISEPSLRTSEYSMNFVFMPPKKEYRLEGSGIICALRGSNVSLIQPDSLCEASLTVRESFLFENGILQSGENECLLFVCRDEGDKNRYLDDISGLKIKWSEYDINMYRTVPQIYVDDYRVNLWYLGPHKHGGIHNHADEPSPFVEFHLQLRGTGWMVKYEDKESKKELEKINMVRGYTHNLFCTVEDKKVTYPWHEYIAGEKGSLFIVFEDTRI